VQGAAAGGLPVEQSNVVISLAYTFAEVASRTITVTCFTERWAVLGWNHLTYVST
jgi:hypothetical protein